MKPVILFRSSLAEEGELDVARQYFDVYGSRASASRSHSLVIPRYSALPYYTELEEDMNLLGCRLINTHTQHKFVADIRNWYLKLKLYTPKTWISLYDWHNRSFEDVLKDTPYILKGSTNSRKQLWNTHCFANSRLDVPKVWNNLSNDTFISEQGIVIREYVPLKRLGEQVTGMPVTNEWRFFICNGQILTGGFYWSNFEDLKPYEYKDLPKPAIDLLLEIEKIVSNYCNFYVIDLAEKEDGTWTLIELNDGSQSGPSCCDLDLLYSALKDSLE